jgi:hypothetical protein
MQQGPSRKADSHSQQFRYRVRNSPTVVHILIQMNAVNYVRPDLSKVHLNTTL